MLFIEPCVRQFTDLNNILNRTRKVLIDEKQERGEERRRGEQQNVQFQKMFQLFG